MTQVTFKTAHAKGEQSITTDATINWDGVTQEQLQALATRSIIIMQQAIYRASGVIPTKDTIPVVALLQRERGAVKLDTPEARASAFNRLVAKMTPAEKAALLNAQRGM